VTFSNISAISWRPVLVVEEAGEIIVFLRRNLPIQNTETKTVAYKSMVRSNLEYCASVWSPHTEKLKSKLEQIPAVFRRDVIDMSVPVRLLKLLCPDILQL
jgi:hypothetical protein